MSPVTFMLLNPPGNFSCHFILSAIFGRVDHSFILEELFSFGFQDAALSWSSSYLTRHFPSVFFFLSFLASNRGVLNGKILELLLSIFSIYLTDNIIQLCTFKYQSYSDNYIYSCHYKFISLV